MESLSRQQIRNFTFVIDLAVFLILLIAFKLNWIVSLVIAGGAGKHRRLGRECGRATGGRVDKRDQRHELL